MVLINRMSKQKAVQFEHFLEKFPVIDLPITLSPDSAHIFSKKNDPLPPLMVNQYIAPFEEDPIDEYTEYVACFRLPNTYGIHAVVYWKAGLLNYHFTLMTFSKEGIKIDRKVIAGTFSDGATLTQSVATIDEVWEIHIVTGQQAVDTGNYDASTSRAHQLELLPEGEIIEVQ